MGYGPGEVSEAARLRHMLRTSGHGITTWGWVMYRCTYQSDAQWQAFMKIINDRVRNHLKFDEDQELMNTLDWHVQEDQRYASATKDQIRRHFRSIRDDISQGDRDPRWRYCIAVDQQCLESVLSGEVYTHAALNDFGYVYLIDSTWGEEPEGEERELNEEDDNEPPIEGCVKEDIGVIKLDTWVVGPRWFVLMWGIGWAAQYRRIPERVNLF